jgi:membrane associated rhomboid family serine protease
MASASYSLADLSKKNRGRPLLDMCYCVCVCGFCGLYFFVSFFLPVGRSGRVSRLLGIFSDLDDEALIIHLLRRRLVVVALLLILFVFSGYSSKELVEKKELKRVAV